MCIRIEVAAEIRVYNLSMAGVEQLVDMPHGIQRTAVCPIGVLFRRQGGLEDRFEHQNCRRLCYAILDRGHSYRLLLSVRLGYPHPPYGLRSIRSTFQLLRQFVQPLLHSVLLDVLKRLAIYSCCSAILVAAFIGSTLNFVFGGLLSIVFCKEEGRRRRCGNGGKAGAVFAKAFPPFPQRFAPCGFALVLCVSKRRRPQVAPWSPRPVSSTDFVQEQINDHRSKEKPNTSVYLRACQK